MNKQSSKENRNNDYTETIWKFCEQATIVTWLGIKPFIQQCATYPLPSIIILIGGYFLNMKLITSAAHLKFLNWIWPSLFSGKFLNWLWNIPAKTQYNGIYMGVLWFYIIVLGAMALSQKRKLQQIFESIGLANRFGQTPNLIYKDKIDQHRELIVLNAKNISEETFMSKKSELESAFGKMIESIKRPGDVLTRMQIILTTKRMPEAIYFEELVSQKTLGKDHFYVGECMNGIVIADIKHLPHLMIAGTTGAGKSVFFKQVLASLLKSSNHLQVYFVDLKNGLEAIDFKEAPNVAIAKSTSDALYFLEKIHTEMNKRFKYLESKGFKTIEPARDKMDRIVIAVDEASELYADKSKFDSDHELSAQIQSLTNSIARLGRAAGIHLILATQKVNKESINTIIQENISARMCFKMNTLQGSLQVLGNKSALELSTTPGRGIWQWGNEECEVQVPYLSGDDVKCICLEVSEDYESGKKKLLQPMIGKQSSLNGKPEDADAVRNSLVDFDA